MDQEQPSPEPGPAEEPAVESRAPARTRRRLRIAVALTLVAAVVVLGFVQVSGLVRPRSSAPDPALPSRIAIVDATGALATMDDHGGSLFGHPVDGVSFQFPAWSPDGSRIAAIGLASDGAGIYVFQARGEGAADPVAAIEPTIIYESAEGPPFYLYWTPDSRQVTFLTQELAGLALRVAPADGSAPAAIIRQGAPLYWDWVDPARVLVNVGAGSPDAFLGEIGLDGVSGEPTDAAGIFRAPAVSRDGSHRAFVIESGDAEAIVVETREGTDRHEIPVPGFAAISFDGSGASLAFIGPATAGSQPAGLPIGPLRVVDVASGSVRTLIDGAIVAFFWSPDGRTIATLRIPGPDDDEIASIGKNPPMTSALAAAIPGYDLRLAFVDVASGEVRSNQTVRVSEQFGLQLLPYFDQYALSHRVWSADSAAILLPLVNQDGVDGIVVLPADGSAQRRVAEGEVGFWSP